jgi:hypothetical protein
LADRFVFGVAPIDYGPVLLLMPSRVLPKKVAPDPPWPYPAFAFVPE